MKKTKKSICISVDRKLYELMLSKFVNNSKYIEWLIYQDMCKNSIEGIETIII